MTIRSTTLRPGLLVALSTSVTGRNVRYFKQTIDSETIVDGAARAKWETERVTLDVAEHEAAAKARSKCRSLISSVCAQSAFGLLCPADAADVLAIQVAEARKVAETFNRTARLSRVDVYVITGKIAPTDQEAIKAINNEVKELMDQMEAGLKNFDVKSIRDAAARAKDLGAMLPPDTQGVVQLAVETARSAARKIVQAGETAAQEVDAAAIRKITEQRTAFLDIDAQGEIAHPGTAGRALDFSPPTVDAPAPTARAIELE